jgi:hypothetical protein
MHGSIEARAAQRARKSELSASLQKGIFAPHKSFDGVPQNCPRCLRFPAAIRSKIHGSFSQEGSERVSVEMRFRNRGIFNGGARAGT